MNDPTETISFEEYQQYMRQIIVPTNKKRPDDRSLNELPIRTAREFKVWWATISTCDKLRKRWIQRIRHREQYLKELEEQVESLKRAA